MTIPNLSLGSLGPDLPLRCSIISTRDEFLRDRLPYHYTSTCTITGKPPDNPQTSTASLTYYNGTFLFELFQWRLYCSLMVLQLTHFDTLSLSQRPYSNTRFSTLHLTAPPTPKFAVRWTQMHIHMHEARFNRGNGPIRLPCRPISPSPRNPKTRIYVWLNDGSIMT